MRRTLYLLAKSLKLLVGKNPDEFLKKLTFFIFRTFGLPGEKRDYLLNKNLFTRVIRVIRSDNIFAILWKIIKYSTGVLLLPLAYRYAIVGSRFEEWVVKVESKYLNPDDISKKARKLKKKPKISVIIPVHKTNETLLRKALDSVKNQLYQNWELCIADDASKKPYIVKILNEYKIKDPRVKVVFNKNHGHISKTSNAALSLATGEYVCFLDHDDELSPNALFEMAKMLNDHPETDLIYSDQDFINEAGERHSPFFKPDWSPDTFLSFMYIGHLLLVKKSLVDRIGGFRVGYEGSQDYDLALRVTEVTDKIYHIPKILYHWRETKGSTALEYSAKSYAHKSSEKALTDALNRRKIKAKVMKGLLPFSFRIKYEISNQPLVSIIIPTKDKVKILENCVNSLLKKTSYKNYEILIVDNNSEERETKKYFEEVVNNSKIRVLTYDKPFNYSKINNFAAKYSKGAYLLFLNNDTEVINKDWLNALLEHAQRKEVGAVGAYLIYPNNLIQHCGIAIGIGKTAGHPGRGFPRSHPGYFGLFKVIKNTSAVTAACIMIRKEVFEKISGFDEQYKIAFNDVDLCLRIREAGYWIIFTPYARFYHHESVSVGRPGSKKRPKMDTLEVNLFQKKWSKVINNDPLYNPNLTLSAEDYSIKVSLYENNKN